MRVSRAVPCALALAAATVLSGCWAATNGMGTPLPTVSRFSIHWRNYSRLEPNKAIAIAGDVNAVFVSGYAFGYPDEASAVAAALAHCEQRRADRRIAAPCVTYAIGDEALLAADTATAALE